MRIVFHGMFAATFAQGIEELLPPGTTHAVVPDALDDPAVARTYSAAEVIVSPVFSAAFPRPEGLRLFHVPGAGTDAVEFAALPPSAIVCNCFGHETAMAEFVFGTLLARTIPFLEADQSLRRGVWRHRSGPADTLHGELAGRTIGVLGYGHIGQAIATRAKAFEMRVHVANRSPIAPSDVVDEAFPLDRLADFYGSVDYVVVGVPLVPETTGLVDAAAFAAMRPDAVLINVARGAVVDETALYEACRDGRIGGAIIDTWYRYPGAGAETVLPSTAPLHELPNVLMTPHMSGWTHGMVRRRQQTMAENIRRRIAGEPCVNQVWPAR